MSTNNDKSYTELLNHIRSIKTVDMDIRLSLTSSDIWRRKCCSYGHGKMLEEVKWWKKNET